MPTIGQTQLPANKLLEHAFRRCGINPSSITVEHLEVAKECLFMLLMSLSSRGLHLWCIDEQYIELAEGQATYDLPAGSLDVLALNLAVPRYTLEGLVSWLRLTAITGDYVLEGSDDGVAYTALQPISHAGGAVWYKLEKQFEFLQYRVVGADDVILASSTWDTSLSPLNRDDFAAIANKETRSERPSVYWFEKLVNPRVTLWPVPNDSTAFVKLLRYRQPQDFDSLSTSIEVPTRWWEAIVWHLALRLAFEIPGVAQERVSAIQQMAQAMTFEADGRETDSAPVYFAPRIGVYTK